MSFCAIHFMSKHHQGTVPFLKHAHHPSAAISASPRSILSSSRQCFALRPRSSRGSSLCFSLFFMSLSLSDLIGPSMRSIQLAFYCQAAPGRPLLPFGGSGFTVRSPMRLSALANRAPCNVSPSAFYASDNPSASSLSSSMQIQQIR